MLSIVIPTHESARVIVRTLASLVPGVIAGVVRDVILADSGSGDGIRQIADMAGCRFVTGPEPVGARLREAAMAARGPWLLFLRPGAVIESAWPAEVERFWMLASGDAKAAKAAVFQPEAYRGQTLGGEIMALARRAFGAGFTPEQGLLLTKSTYELLGGHEPDRADAEQRLLRKIGRKNIATLRVGISGG